jgi:putative SOS response-associated peptidase YedK
VAVKPAFRHAFRERRCLVPADGFYEWKKTGPRSKQPYFIRVRGGRPFAFAGLWEHWEGKDGELLDSCTIITTDANNTLRPLHDRMPVILPPEAYAQWLDPRVEDPNALAPLLAPYPDDAMDFYAISPTVNNARNETPACIEPQPETEDARIEAKLEKSKSPKERNRSLF